MGNAESMGLDDGNDIRVGCEVSGAGEGIVGKAVGQGLGSEDCIGHGTGLKIEDGEEEGLGLVCNATGLGVVTVKGIGLGTG